MQCHIFVSLVTPRFLKKKVSNFLDFVMTLVNLGARLFLEKYQHFYTTKTSYYILTLPTILTLSF